MKILLILALSLLIVLSTARAEVLDSAIQEMVNEMEQEIQKYHLTSTNYETEFCNTSHAPRGILRHLCKSLLRVYLYDHVTSIAGFRAALLHFVSGK